MTARTTTIVRRSLAPSLLAAVAFGAAACGSASEPSTGNDGPAILPSESSESEALGGRLLGEFTVQYIASTGKLEFTRLDRGPLATKGFTQVADGNITFTTTAAITGPGTYAGGTCNANQLCAQVNVANGTGVDVETLWVGVTSISNATVANGDTAPTGYGILPSNGAWKYGNIATAGNATKEWRFNYTGDFSFNVAVFGTFLRTSYTHAATTPSAVNACTLGGTRILDDSALYGDLNDQTDTITFPFPITVFGTTRTSGYVTTNGVFGLVTAKETGANRKLSSYVTSMPRPGLFAFWDDLVGRDGHGVCYATTGSAPSRSFVITWDDFCFNSTSDSCGSDTTNSSHLTFSIVFHEGDDDFEFYYEQLDAPSSWSTSQKRRAKGSSATIGVNGLVGSTYSYDQFSFNSNALGTAPYQISFNALPNNPAAK